MSFLVTNAMAAAPATTAAAPPDSTFSLLMMAAIFILFYFMLIRPQNKRAKEQRNLIESVKKGDEVVTSGGFLGKVANLDEQYIKLDMAEGVTLTLQRGAIIAILPKGTMKSL